MRDGVFRFYLVCPRCHRESETVADHRSNPRVNCGDCLFEHVEIVELKVIKVVEEERP